jgi:hypothetical protein
MWIVDQFKLRVCGLNIFIQINLLGLMDASDDSCKPAFHKYRGPDKSLSLPTSFQLFFSVQETGSPMGPDLENRVGDQDIGSPGRPVSSGLQALGESFPSWSG